ncbi:hypothetical protein [Picosynechococcus sp. PCC 7117]|uniref:hypothetical protein n=1 Tax=Picosynechococcus sp. PCC 7117 TaxID=195498 RepID=UPI000810EE8A|nr:hypothetical protein [Picosynechococcus sp. PCC 7117]ANV87360.1 hypothetical protein AWQ22_07770 [Picosynechococcus sp. PCC 7117]
MSCEIGVYFSANDIVCDWAIAFLNSYRTFNPDLRLILIPFNDQCDRLLKLQNTYNFEIYTDSSFERLEAIGKAFELGHTPTGPYWFRRYAAFWGECDRFMYLDARQVVLADLKPIIQALDDYDFELLHFDCAINQVYEPGELCRVLLRQGKARGFNSGRWAARKKLFSLKEFEQFATDALKVRDQLNPRNTDQAFINYCCDMKPVRYGHVAEVLGGICQSSWARQSGKVYQNNGRYHLWDYGGLDHKKQLILLHWAGYQQNKPKPHSYLYFYYKNQRTKLLLKYLDFFKYKILYFERVLIRLILSNRKINTTYHQIKNDKNKTRSFISIFFTKTTD